MYWQNEAQVASATNSLVYKMKKVLNRSGGEHFVPKEQRYPMKEEEQGQDMCQDVKK